MKKIIKIGDIIGMIKVLKLKGTDKHGHKRFLCECYCGKEFIVLGSNLISFRSKSCGCARYETFKKRIGEKNPNWKGYKKISESYWYRIKDNAKKRNLELNIDIKYIWELFLKQERKCALSGLELILGYKKATASLDRIDSSKGYIKGNVQWVHKDINMMKNIYDEQYFIEMCKKVVEYKI